MAHTKSSKNAIIFMWDGGKINKSLSKDNRLKQIFYVRVENLPADDFPPKVHIYQHGKESSVRESPAS